MMQLLIGDRDTRVHLLGFLIIRLALVALFREARRIPVSVARPPHAKGVGSGIAAVRVTLTVSPGKGEMLLPGPAHGGAPFQNRVVQAASRHSYR
jgi:hypothetical protein